MSASEREQAIAYSSRAANGNHDSGEAAVSTAGANRDIIGKPKNKNDRDTKDKESLGF
jgi:hypothetical protein